VRHDGHDGELLDPLPCLPKLAWLPGPLPWELVRPLVPTKTLKCQVLLILA
jgi:hypothetical protein